MNQDMKDIILALIEKSKAKQVHWVHARTIEAINPDNDDPDPAAEDFAVHTPTYTINLYRSPNHPTIRLLIYNEEADLVTNEPVSPDDPFFSKMRELLDLARRYALG